MFSVDGKSRLVSTLIVVLVGVCIAFIVTAGLVAYLAINYQGCHRWLMMLVQSADDLLHLTKLSSRSHFPDINAIYILVVYPLPVFLAALFVLSFAFPFQGRLARPYIFRQRVIGTFSIPFLLFIASIPYWVGRGEDVRFFKFGSQINQLILFKWVPFAVSGFFFGISVIIFVKLVSRK